MWYKANRLESITKNNMCDCGRTSKNLVYEKQGKLDLDKDKKNPKALVLGQVHKNIL